MRSAFFALAALLAASSAGAVEPVGSKTFNTDAGFDLSKLTTENFLDVVVPLAKKDGRIVFYDFTDSFGPLFNNTLLPAFEKQYGIKVEYVRGSGDTAAQQLIAAHNAGGKVPADVYFVSSGKLTALFKAGVIANLPLASLLPNGRALNPSVATVTDGVDHGGAYVPFHRNQTSIAYDSRAFASEAVPDTLDTLLTWAKAHPGKLVVTKPTGGGSGSGFLQSIAFAKVVGDACRAPFTDFSITPEVATTFAAGPCVTPVWDYYRELLPFVEVANGNSDTLNLLAGGAGVIGTAWEDMTYDFVGRGLLPRSIRQEILKEGQVGGGDGMFIPAGARSTAAGLLLVDFMLSRDTQLTKLQLNGSRTARLDVDPAGSFTPEQIDRLIPTAQFKERARVAMPAALTSALSAHFVSNVLRK